MSDSRTRQADALVDSLQREAGGKLTVFLGAAPGVGKTFSMLTRAHEQLRRGVDVVIVIPALIPLALRGVRFRPATATALLRRNMLVYGLGGVLLPFAAIKVIDLFLVSVFGA